MTFCTRHGSDTVWTQFGHDKDTIVHGILPLGMVEDTVVHGLLLSDTVKDTVGHRLNRMTTRFLHGRITISARYCMAGYHQDAVGHGYTRDGK